MKHWQKVLAIAALSLIVVVAVLPFVLDSIITSKARDQAAQLSKEWGRPRHHRLRLDVAHHRPRRERQRPAHRRRGGRGRAAARSQARRGEGCAPARGALVRQGRGRFLGGDRRAHRQRRPAPRRRHQPGSAREEDRRELSAAEGSAGGEEAERSVVPAHRPRRAAGRENRLHRQGRCERPELAIQHVELTVDDLSAGKPLEIVLKAAVLAEKQNLELRVKAAPLPPTLTPTPTTIVLRVDPPIDIGPLGPFAGKGLGLSQGTLDADFDAELGAAVPGGKGPTSVKGTVKLAALRFKAAEKPLDVTLDADVKGDAAAGDVQIDKLRLDIGPAGITGK